MKGKRELSIAMVLVGLVGINFFWIFEVFFRGLGDALFRWHGGDMIDWITVVAIIVANIVALVGLFYLVQPQPGVSTESGLTQEGPTEGASTEAGPTPGGPAPGGLTEGGPTEGGPTEGVSTEDRPTEGGPSERQGN